MYFFICRRILLSSLLGSLSYTSASQPVRPERQQQQCSYRELVSSYPVTRILAFLALNGYTSTKIDAFNSPTGNNNNMSRILQKLVTSTFITGGCLLGSDYLALKLFDAYMPNIEPSKREAILQYVPPLVASISQVGAFVAAEYITGSQAAGIMSGIGTGLCIVVALSTMKATIYITILKDVSTQESII